VIKVSVYMFDNVQTYSVAIPVIYKILASMLHA